MTPERWVQIKQIFQDALEREPAERDSFLAEACGADGDLRAELGRMLEEHDSAPSFLDHGPSLSLDPELPVRGQTFLPGEVVAGRFRVVRHIGSGGMGEVYEAEDSELSGQRVALKTVVAGLGWTTQARNLFEREVLLARQVTHPNVCRINDIYRHRFGGSPEAETEIAVLSMELLEGPSLAQRLREAGPLGADEGEQVARALLGALGAVHEAGVVHGDLKPSNIVLAAGAQGRLRPVVTDFGLARAAGAPAGPAGGTPSYMAPEQLQGAAATQATDIYGFGLVMYEAYTGRALYPRARSFEEARAQRGEGSPDRLPPHPAIPPRRHQILERCLRGEPGKRYGSVGELRRAWDGEVGRRRALLLLAAGAGAWSVLRGRSGPPAGDAKPVVILPFENSAGDPEADYFVRGLTAELRRSVRQMPEIRVMGGYSSEAVAEARLSYASMGQRLGVGWVVSGAIRFAGGQIRATLQLSDARTGVTAWSRRFESPGGEAFLLQLQMAAAIAESVRARRTASGTKAANRCAPGNGAAYLDYLKGRRHLSERGDASLVAAAEDFRRALQADPEFAAAWAALAEAQEMLAGRPGHPLVDTSVESRRSVARALELCPDLTEALLESAMIVQRFDYRWQEAEGIFRRVLALDPNDVAALRQLGGLLANLGRGREAWEPLERARQLDPLSPAVQNNLATALLRDRQYPEAISAFEQLRQQHRTFAGAYPLLTDAYCRAGMGAQALRVAEEAIEQFGRRPMFVYPLAQVHATMGRRAASLAVADQLAAEWTAGLFYPMFVAEAYCAAGERERMMQWLRTAVRERDPGVILLGVDAKFDTYRRDTEFLQILGQVNLIRGPEAGGGKAAPASNPTRRM